MNSLSDQTKDAFKRFIDDGLHTAIFDLDGTIARTNITHLYFFLRRRSFSRELFWNIWRFSQYAVYGPPFLLIDRIDRPTFQRLFFRRYHRFSVGELMAAAHDYFTTHSHVIILPGTAALLEWLKQEGIYIEIHSTNLVPIVAQFARHFDVPYAAVQVEDVPSGCRIRTDGLRSFKLDALQPFSLSHTAVIADSRSDLPALRAVAYPVLVSDDVPQWSKSLDMLIVDTNTRVIRHRGVTGSA
jgi:phosphoserine phosphatase